MCFSKHKLNTSCLKKSKITNVAKSQSQPLIKKKTLFHCAVFLTGIQ